MNSPACDAGSLHRDLHNAKRVISPDNGSCRPAGNGEFTGDYFGNITATGSVDYSSFVSSYDDGTNPAHCQQQIVAASRCPDQNTRVRTRTEGSPEGGPEVLSAPAGSLLFQPAHQRPQPAADLLDQFGLLGFAALGEVRPPAVELIDEFTGE